MNTKNFIFRITSLCFLSSFILMSCKSDSEDIIIDNPTAINGLEVMTYGYYGKNGKSSGGTTIASFSDQQTYDNYVGNLETQVEAWDDQFVAQWGHLNEDALNDKEEALGFDSEKPLTDFENQAGLNSLRQQYLTEEEAWLNNEVLNDGTDPDNKPEYNFDEHEMAVINKLAEVKIGTTIYKQLNESEIIAINDAIQRKSIKKSMPVLRDGAMLEIGDADFNTLIAFNEGDVDVIDNGNVNVNTSSSAVGCEYGKTKRATIQTSSSRRIKAVIKVPQPKFGWNGKVKTKIKSYKKKGRRWKKRRTNIAAGARGTVGNVTCVGDAFFIDSQWTSTKKRKKRVYKWRNPYFTSHKVENGGMTGLYKQDGVVKELKLTW